MNRHVYYKCTKSRDADCSNPPITEMTLSDESLTVIDTISMDKIGIKDRLEKEMERFSKFQMSVLGVQKEITTDKTINIRNYAKYLLKEGNTFEKREILSCLKSKLLLKDKKLILG